MIGWAGGVGASYGPWDTQPYNQLLMNIHAKDEPNSVQELENLAAAYPSVPIILAHCLFTANTALVDGLLTKHPSMYCELSARNESMFAKLVASENAIRVMKLEP